MSEDHPERRRQQLYGRRKGPKLSPHQVHLRETLLPQLTLDLARLHDPRNAFDRLVKDVWLEVGFGAGEHLLWQAENHPQIGIIGAEPYESGVAKLLSKLDPNPNPSSSGGVDARSAAGEDGSSRTSERPPPLRTADAAGEATPPQVEGFAHDRIRIHEGDARDIIRALPDASIGRVFILFPDPWPKTRHHKRRFVQSDLLSDLARILKDGSELRFASDDAGYLEWALERLMAHPDFGWLATDITGWTRRPAGWPPTRYEEKALHGPPVYLRFVRRVRV